MINSANLPYFQESHHTNIARLDRMIQENACVLNSPSSSASENLTQVNEEEEYLLKQVYSSEVLDKQVIYFSEEGSG